MEERDVGQFGKEVDEGAASSGAKQQPSGNEGKLAGQEGNAK